MFVYNVDTKLVTTLKYKMRMNFQMIYDWSVLMFSETLTNL